MVRLLKAINMNVLIWVLWFLGNDWRNLRNEMDSSLQILGKTVTQIVLSNSIRPEYKQLAKRKINISVQSVKFNLSDEKINSILDFIENTPIPINHVSSATLKKHYSDDDEVYALDMVGDLNILNI